MDGSGFAKRNNICKHLVELDFRSMKVNKTVSPLQDSLEVDNQKCTLSVCVFNPFNSSNSSLVITIDSIDRKRLH